ncbi:MAG TPA: dienelactone hydrolase family protein [Chlamydiales bacterium]|nr:dienelactone hydrolase family protein [Chlamydiales bacterium]
MQTELIDYTDKEVLLEAFVAHSGVGKRPLVILCHAWAGRNEFICEKARAVAELGYVGFALDIYGKGIIGRSKEENASLKKPFLEDRHRLHRRLLKGIEKAASLPYVDASRIAAIGYGFGGLCALDLARIREDLKGAVSIYGHFEPPPFPHKKIQAKLLLLHGANDPTVPIQELFAFTETITTDWQAHIYGNTFHGFPNPPANDRAGGILYNPLAAERSWLAVENFLTEIFPQ